MSKAFPEWWKHGQKVRTASDGILTLNISEDAEYWLTNDAGKEVSVFSADILGPASTPEACSMTTDITELAQRLKAAAENATPGEWCSDDQYGIVADAGLNGNYYIASCSGPEHRSNKRFIALANPANVLALVEALEKAQQRVEELESDLSEWTDCKHDGATYYDMSGQERCGRCGADV